MKRKRRNNPIAVAMRKRHPRSKQMTSPNKRRQKDTKNSWKNDEDIDNLNWKDPDYLWQLPTDSESPTYDIPHTVDMECWHNED
tara:strand:+ start:508 stop:759 length:252 start_codon:yes stop_codon:yes gene_type:complete